MADTQTVQVAADIHQRPSAPLATPSFRKERPQVVGPDTPGSPYPIYLSGDVQHGFGRGGKDLGCPTANLPEDSIAPMTTAVKTGIYYGYAQVIAKQDQGMSADDLCVHPMVMSLGWNPFFQNERLSAEIHIMHTFASDFYGYEMKAVVLGYIRPEFDYVSREALIEDIETDKRVALNCLERPAYDKFSKDPHFVCTS